MRKGLKKVLVKVIRDGGIEWVHLSAVDETLYKRFFETTNTRPVDLNDYLSQWCKDDFDVRLRMYKYNDIYHLKKAINERFQTEYAELYGSAEMPEIRGWVRMWLSQHMEMELLKIEERKRDKDQRPENHSC